jgi:hypothetical protein
MDMDMDMGMGVEVGGGTKDLVTVTAGGNVTLGGRRVRSISFSQ